MALFRLCGPVQTVRGAELFAVLHVLRRTKGNIQIWTDHQAIPNIFSRPQKLDRVELLDNSDLWQQIRSLVYASPYTIEVYWVNAHADRDVAQHGIGYDPRIAKSIYLLNDKADDLANLAAAAHEIDEQLAKQQLDLEAQTEQILKRMVAAAMLAAAELGQLPKRQPPPELPRFSFWWEASAL